MKGKVLTFTEKKTIIAGTSCEQGGEDEGSFSMAMAHT
jgi:hypothetical protein